MRTQHARLVLALLLAGGCSSGPSDTVDVGPAPDSGPARDAAAVPDTGVVVHPDATQAQDAAPQDAAPPADAGFLDAAAPDARLLDASGTMDALPRDASQPRDATEPDGGQPADASDLADTGTVSDAGPRPDAGFTVDMITDENGVVRMIQNGPPGPPTTVGCADGQREGFVDDGRFPNVAGCLGTWSNTLSLRTSTTGAACGDDNMVPCASPQDICAPGWHICGTSGVIGEVQAIGPNECANAGGGRYVTAISHCLTQSGCVYNTMPTAVYPCFPTGWCSEPVCCGQSCPGFGACPSGIWPNATHIPVGTDQGCAAMSARRAGGVICCR